MWVSLYLCQEVIELSTEFHSSRTASHHQEMQQSLSLLRLSIVLCRQLKIDHYLVPDLSCIRNLLGNNYRSHSVTNISGNMFLTVILYV